MFVDSHCHLDRLDKSPEELTDVLNFARNRGVEHFLCVSVSVKDFPAMLSAVSSFKDVSVCGVAGCRQGNIVANIEQCEEGKVEGS